MHKIDEQSFGIVRSFVGLSYFGIWFFGALAVLSVGLGVVGYVENPENKGAIVVYVLMTLFFFGFAYGTFRVTRQFGKDEETLIKLEYQLEGFEILRQIVIAKTDQANVEIECPATFKKSVGYHLFTIVATIGFTALSYYAGKIHLILGLLSFGVVVVLSTYEYLKTVVVLTVNRRTLDIRYPLRTKTIGLSEVSSINLSDKFVKGARHPEVIVTSHTGGKPIRLRQLGEDASTLYDLLDKWNNEILFV